MRLVRALLFIVIACAAWLSSGCTGAAEAATAKVPDMRLRTYNVNYGGVTSSTLEAIGDGAPDLVLLQETTAEWERAIRPRWAGKYPHIRFHHSRGAGGLALLSKWPITSMNIVASPNNGWFPAMLAEVETPKGAVKLINVHLRPPFDDKGSLIGGYFTTGAIRLAEIQHYMKQLKKTDRVIIAGDFNESDGQAVRFLRSAGLESVPTLGTRYTNTWRWKTMIGQIGRHLDHVVINPKVFSVSKAAVRPLGASDHLPVDVSLAIR